MTPNPDRFRLGWLTAQYLEAIEADDTFALEQLWKLAETDADLVAAFERVHADLAAEEDEREAVAAAAMIAAAVETHLPSAVVIRPAAGPVTVADVANELFHHAPDRLPAAAHALNETLRASHELLPADLGLSRLVAWAAAKFGPAPPEYWKAFREAALKLELRRAATTEYQLAARTAPQPGEKK